MASFTPAPAMKSPTPSTQAQKQSDSENLSEEQKLKMTRGNLQYRTDVTYNPCDLDGPFWIIFFFGPPPSDRNIWLIGPNTVGVLFAYTDTRPPPGAKYGRCMPPDSKWGDAVELNAKLLEKTWLVESDLEFFPRDVVGYLKENLNWRVIMASPPPPLPKRTTTGDGADTFSDLFHRLPTKGRFSFPRSMCRSTLLDGITTPGRLVPIRDFKILPTIPRLPEESRGVEDDR